LSTAIEINQEEAAPNEDGLFFIQLLIERLKQLVTRIPTNEEVIQDNTTLEVHTIKLTTEDMSMYQLEEGINYSTIDIRDVVKIIIDSLQTMETTLEQKDYNLYLKQASALYKILNIAHAYCKIYLDYIRPVTHKAIRKNSFNDIYFGLETSQIQQTIANLIPFQTDDIDVFIMDQFNALSTDEPQDGQENKDYYVFGRFQ